jgi:VPDSG-CTERM motif
MHLSTATHLLPREARMTIATMKKCLLSTLLALALACGAYAGQNQNGQNQNGQNQNGQGQNGPVVSVPDNGNTVLLLGTAILALGIASRRFAIH